MEELEQPPQMTPAQLLDVQLEVIEETIELIKEDCSELNEKIQSLDNAIHTCNDRLHDLGNAVSGKLSMSDLMRIITPLVEDVLKARGLL